MSKKYAYVVGAYDYGVSAVWRGYGCEIVDRMEEADIVIFTGGTDVSCGMYNEKPHKYQQRPATKRDISEVDEYYKAIGLSKNIFGICRGAQLIHVLNGNKLWQHVDNHIGGGHELLDVMTSETHFVSSCHHQMMRVDGVPHGNEEYKIVAVAAESTFREMHDFRSKPKAENKSGFFTDDIEVLWYPRMKAICYQAHPEFGIKTDSRYARELQVRFGFLDSDAPKTPVTPVEGPPPLDALMSRIAERIDPRARMHAH